jgi:hypothetical protein|uniref:Uncharacterized protein n=1 Tax=Siphoviridae sp. ctf8W5 TaxID=2825595 RepID=A0A8S5Q7I4_9CAUD|nr:MAG TPA: hypothetical protein [Siphoviridae sp. ctf8W5]
MSYTYEIKINGQVVEPADESIQEIYAGSKLIWKRKDKQELFADITFASCRFTRRGLIVPAYLSQTSRAIYEKTGQKVSEFNITNLLSEYETGGFVYNDTPAYTISSTEGTVYARDLDDFLYTAGAAENVLTRSTLNLTDTNSQWSGYYNSIPEYLRAYKTTIASPGGSGILPLSRQLGAPAGAEKFGPLCYVKDGKLITDAGYVVLSVCGDSLICAEDIIMSNSNRRASGYITERTLTGEKVQQFFTARQRLLSYPYYTGGSVSGSENPRHYYKVHNALFYYALRSGVSRLNALNLDSNVSAECGIGTEPECVFYYNGRYYAVCGSAIYYSADPMLPADSTKIPLPTDEYGKYNINFASAGGYYVDRETGILYTIIESVNSFPTKEGGKAKNYKLIKINLNNTEA